MRWCLPLRGRPVRSTSLRSMQSGQVSVCRKSLSDSVAVLRCEVCFIKSHCRLLTRHRTYVLGEVCGSVGPTALLADNEILLPKRGLVLLPLGLREIGPKPL